MKCSICKEEFPEKELQLSHDIPKYMGGKDSDGRHYLCKRCHDIYERMVFAIMVSNLSEEEREVMRKAAKSYSLKVFKKEESENDST